MKDEHTGLEDELTAALRGMTPSALVAYHRDNLSKIGTLHPATVRWRNDRTRRELARRGRSRLAGLLAKEEALVNSPDPDRALLRHLRTEIRKGYRD